MAEVTTERGDILVVDDQFINLRFLTTTLTQQGYKVRPAISGKLALEAVQKHHPDLILLDVMMPDLNGYDVCEQLKKSPLTRDIPVIFLSALDKPQDKVRAFTVGGIDYITKPFHINEVIARVETQLTVRAMQKQLEHKNEHLRQEIAERIKAEESLKAHQDQLEELVRERTVELTTANQQLQHEIAERKKIEFALQESQQFLQSTLDSLSSHIAILDERGIIYAVNDSWKQFGNDNGFSWENYGVGYSYFSVLKHAANDGENEVLEISEAIKDIANRKRDHFWTSYGCHSPYKKRWFSMRVSRFEGISGGRIVISHENITEQMLAEETLRESENLLRAVINTTRDGIIAVDEEGIITLFNPAAERMFGYKQSQMVGQTLDSLIPEQVRPTHRAYVKKFFDGETQLRGVGSTVEFPAIRSDGQVFPMELSLTLGQSDTNRLVVGLVRDITKRKQVEEERRERENFLALLNDVTRATLETSDLKSILQILANQLGQLFGADNVYLVMWDEQQQVAQAAVTLGSAPKDFTSIKAYPNEVSLTGSVLKARRAIVVRDVKNSPFINPRFAALFPDTSVLGLPLIAGHQKLGAALVGFLEPHQFTPAEIARGEQMARQIALAVAKTRLLEETQTRWREAETLRKATESITHSLSLDERLNVILEQLEQVVPYDSASVQLLNDDHMEIVNVRGFPDPAAVIGLQFPTSGDSVNAEIVRTQAPLILTDVREQYQHYFGPPHGHVVSWLGIPMIVQNRLIGLLAVDSTTPNYFTQKHVRLIMPFANQVAVALENAQLFEQARQDAKTKAALLKEVNHRVKNNLSAIIGLLYAERRHAGGKDDSVYQKTMTGLINRIRGLAGVHSMLSASEWSPLQLDEMAKQLIEICLQMLPSDKRALVSVTPSTVQVSSKHANNLALVINELATNSIKHAGIDRELIRIRVEIENDGDQVTFVYKDDGPGYPASVLQNNQTNLGLYLAQTLVTGGLRGKLLFCNEDGAKSEIVFNASNS